MSQERKETKTGTLSEEDVKAYRATFDLFDINKDGTISATELGTVLRGVGCNPTEAELQDLVHDNDFDGNGTIDFEEFLVLMTKQQPKKAEEDELREAFNVFDLDHNGYISADELRKMMTEIGENFTDAEVDRIFKEADIDSNSKIDYNEFAKMVMNA